MWRRVGQLLIALLLCAPLVRAQGVIYRSVATGKRLSGDTFVTVPLPGASVRVCTGVQTTVPCTPLAQIYGDQGLTVVSPNPLTADQNGNYFFWAQPGTYTVQIFHPLAPVATFSIVLSPALGSTNTWTAPNTFTAPVSFSGSMTFSGSTTVQSSLTLATPNAATATQAQNSPPLAFTGAYWTGTASASDTWTLQDVIAAGTNGSAGLVLSHSGSPSNYIELNASVGINKVPATALDVSGGLGVSGNASIGGSLTLGIPLAVSSGGTGAATASANTVFAGPTSGAAAAPSFRSLVAADIPAGNSCPAGQYATALGSALTLSCAQVAYSQISGTPTLYYQTVQANGTAQTQRPVLNLVSGSNASVSCADDATNNRTSCTVSAVGTVTSVGLAAPAQFTVAGSPVTTSGTLTLAWTSQSANTVLAGPSSGAAAAPTFRTLVGADIPPINLAAGGNGGVTGVLPTQNGGTGNNLGLLPWMNVTFGVPTRWQTWTYGQANNGTTLPSYITGLAQNLYGSSASWVLGNDGANSGGASIVSGTGTPLQFYNFPSTGPANRTLTAVYPIAEFDGDSSNSSSTRGIISLWGLVGIGKHPSTTLDVAGNASISGGLTVTGTLSAPGVPVVVYATPSATTNVGTGIASTTMATAGSSGNVYEVSATIVPVLSGTGCSNAEQSNVYLDITTTDARSLSSIDLQATLSWSGNGATALQAVVPATVVNVAANATVSYSTTSDGATTCTTPPTYYVIPIVKKLQ